MTLTVRPGDPRSAEGRALLGASHAYLRALYPPEQNFFLSIDDLCVPSISFFIAEDGDRTLGCVALADKREDGGDYGEVKSLWVDPEVRGSGAGAALMARLDAQGRALGLGWLRLETGPDLLPAHRLYERAGFTFCGAFGDYAEGPGSVFMEKRL